MNFDQVLQPLIEFVSWRPLAGSNGLAGQGMRMVVLHLDGCIFFPNHFFEKENWETTRKLKKKHLIRWNVRCFCFSSAETALVVRMAIQTSRAAHCDWTSAPFAAGQTLRETDAKTKRLSWHQSFSVSSILKLPWASQKLRKRCYEGLWVEKMVFS